MTDTPGRSSGIDKRAPAVALTVLSAAIGMIGGFAVLISGTFSLFLKPISESMNWTRSQASLLPTMALLGYAVGSPVIGRLYDRAGVRRFQFVAVVVFALGIACLSMLPNSLAVFAFVMAVIGLTAAATAPSGYVLILAKTFSFRLGLVIALAMVGLGLGLVFAPSAAQAMISLLGWRRTYLLFAIIALACGLASLALGLGRSVETAAARRVATAGPLVPVVEGMSLGEALREWRFWLLVASCMVMGVVGFGTQAYLAAALLDAGVAQADTARMAGLFGGGILAGRITAALLMDRFFAPAIAVLYCLFGGIGLLMLARLSPGQTSLAPLATCAAGLLTGSEGDMMPFLTRHYFGMRAFGSIYGWVIGFAGVGALLGPIAYGASFDQTGGYALILNTAAIAVIASGASLLLLGRYRYYRRIAA